MTVATTTANIEPREAPLFGKRRRKKRHLIKKRFPKFAILKIGESAMLESDEWRDVLMEAAKVGGSAFLKAMFARGILRKRKGKKKKGAKSSLYTGWKGRTYRLTKLGGGKYRVERVK